MKQLIPFFLFVYFAFFLSQIFAEDSSLLLTATEDNISVQIDFDWESAIQVSLVRCHPHEYYPTTDFLLLYDGVGDDCSEDGYRTDRKYYDPENCLAILERSNISKDQKTFEIARFSNNAIDKDRDKIFDKFYLIANGTVENEIHRKGIILAGPFYVTEFPSRRTDARIEKKSIKGLEVKDIEDAKKLGVSHAAITVDLCSFLGNSNEPTIEFICNGKPYCFNKKVVENYDQQVIDMTAADMEITFVLVFWGHRISLAPSEMIHPDFEVWLDLSWTLSIAAPNLTTLHTVEYWQALFEFLGDRYTRKDGKFGLVSNFVIGNELNSGYIWNNMGRLPLDETIRQYERGLRIASTALRKYWSNAHILMSLDNYWNSESATEFQQFHYSQKGGFKGKDYLIALNSLTKKEGDYSWKIAYHPYGLDLRTPVYWDQHSVQTASLDENAKRLTPFNIEILPRFLDRPEMRFDGQRRDFYFTEQGFSSPHEDDYMHYNADHYNPEAIPQIWLERQAAAYAYAHYKFVSIGAKANIFHRHFDLKSEQLNIGLWTRPSDQNGGYYSPKPIYELFRLIDTDQSFEASSPYLRHLIFYPQTVPPKNWNEIIPQFEIVEKSLELKNNN
ncbi:MAG: DUF5722 domain-containing protein [Planctomycetia bacterium]|nr:DUF5722 domain-containing protein [Planctomycetia bacterium]